MNTILINKWPLANPYSPLCFCRLGFHLKLHSLLRWLCLRLFAHFRWTSDCKLVGLLPQLMGPLSEQSRFRPKGDWVTEAICFVLCRRQCSKTSSSVLPLKFRRVLAFFPPSFWLLPVMELVRWKNEKWKCVAIFAAVVGHCVDWRCQKALEQHGNRSMLMKLRRC